MATTATEHAQSLAEFRDAVAETLDRVNRTGEPEAITVDGERRAVLVPPAVYDDLAREAQVSRDVSAIRRSVADYEAGDYMEANAFFDQLRAKLLARQAVQECGGGE